MLNNRDVCLFGQRYMGTPANRDEAGVATSLSMSIQHPACPRVKGVVRGFLNIGLTYFREVDGGKACTVTSVLHMDPRGMIPPSLINTMAAHTVGSIVDMKVCTGRLRVCSACHYLLMPFHIAGLHGEEVQLHLTKRNKWT